MVVHPAAMIAAIEPHVASARLTDLLETEHLGPEFVRLFHVAHVDHEMIETARGHRLGRGLGYDWRGAVRHHQAPRSKIFAIGDYMGAACPLPIAPGQSRRPDLPFSQHRA